MGGPNIRILHASFATSKESCILQDSFQWQAQLLAGSSPGAPPSISEVRDKVWRELLLLVRESSSQSSSSVPLSGIASPAKRDRLIRSLYRSSLRRSSRLILVVVFQFEVETTKFATRPTTKILCCLRSRGRQGRGRLEHGRWPVRPRPWRPRPCRHRRRMGGH